MPEVFGVLDDLQADGKLRHYGVSVEKVEEALRAIKHPGVQSVQIIFNMFRQKPRDDFFAAARERGVGIFARLPLSSGMLSGKLTPTSTFAVDDHRSFNREGAAFDRGETFSGLDYDVGLQAVESLRAALPAGMPLAQLALRWILMFPEVTCAIPGSKRPAQVEENVAAADLPPLSAESMAAIEKVYDEQVRPHVHQYW
jgi:aryl-alcohol dehydrogenase-like predicted oxidoreductase